MHLLEWIFPKQCIYCSRVGYDICDNCLKKIPKSLPCCFICNKIVNKGETHKECFPTKAKICYKRGWYISPKRLLILNSKKILCLNSAHKYLLNRLIEDCKLKNDILRSDILPLNTNISTDFQFNISLVKSMKGGKSIRGSRKIYLVGESLPNIECIREQLSQILRREIRDIYILTIF